MSLINHVGLLENSFAKDPNPNRCISVVQPRATLSAMWSSPIIISVLLWSASALLRTPTMGWNNCQIDCGPKDPNDTLVRSTADALVKLGLRDAGYNHLNLDDAWMGYNRSVEHLQVPDRDRFPAWLDTIAYVKRSGPSSVPDVYPQPQRS